MFNNTTQYIVKRHYKKENKIKYTASIPTNTITNCLIYTR